jgi:hypothetical protein
LLNNKLEKPMTLTNPERDTIVHALRVASQCFRSVPDTKKWQEQWQQARAYFRKHGGTEALNLADRIEQAEALEDMPAIHCKQIELQPGPHRWVALWQLRLELENSIPITVTKHNDGRITFSERESKKFKIFTFIGV